MLKNILIFTSVCLLQRIYVNGHCIDIHSHIISQGLHYVPGPNSCTLCICDKGSPKWCKSVLCSQPQNCKSFQRGNSCCEFKCLDDILTANDTYKDTYDLALRLIASAVFAILTLSLLFFVIHRFRRRKLRIRQNRQLGEDQRSLNSIGYIAGSLGYLPGNIGYLGSGNNELEFHYEEANAHYSLWKPPGNYFPRGEAPPPYEEAVRSAHIENGIISNQLIITNPNNISVQSHQLQSHQLQSHQLQSHHLQTHQLHSHHLQSSQLAISIQQNVPSVVQSRYENSINRPNNSSNNSNNNNINNQEYANVAVPSLPMQQNLNMVKNESNEVNMFAKSHSHVRVSHTTPVQNKHSKNTSAKSKSYENIIVARKNDKPTTSAGCRVSKPKLTNPLGSDKTNADKNNSKYHKYENIVIKNPTPALKDICSLKKTDKVKAMDDNNQSVGLYENIDNSFSGGNGMHHRTIPNLSEYQCNKASTFTKEYKSKDNSLLGEGTSRRDFDKAHFGERSESNLKNLIALKNHKDLPLHRTLPKNLKELSIQLTSNDEFLQDSAKKSELEKLCHRSLPKQLSSLDCALALNLVKSHINLTDSYNQKQNEIESSSILVSVLEPKTEVKVCSRQEERSFISYQCLSSSQDEDDYRSECENCKSTEIVNVEDEESDVFNETMTLQRRPLDICEEVPYYRTSLTLPTQIRKPRAVTPNPGRDGWFMAMQETSSSEESD